MRKKILVFILTFILFFSFSEFVSAAKKQYICKYKGGDISAEFRLRLGKDSKTYAETAEVTDNWFGEEVINWSSSIKGTNFSGKKYYDENGNCPPYAYFFKGQKKSDWFNLAPSKLLVAPEDLGGDFEKNLKKQYKIDGKIKVLTLIGDVIEAPPEKLPTSCLDFTEKGDSSATLAEDKYPCEHNPYFACVWNETSANPAGGYCNTDSLQYVKCGDAFDVPAQVPQIISFVVNLLKIATPIILVIVSVIALLKALAASKEDEIKKAQQSLIKKMIAAVMVFFVISIVQFVILKVADVSETEGISNCLSCMLNNDCTDTLYYKTNVGGQYFCTGLSGNEIECGETEHQND